MMCTRSETEPTPFWWWKRGKIRIPGIEPGTYAVFCYTDGRMEGGYVTITPNALMFGPAIETLVFQHKLSNIYCNMPLLK